MFRIKMFKNQINVKLTQKEICDKWLKNKTINPETSRKIKENGAVYKELSKLCSLNPLNQKDLCDKWLENKNINPETLRKIKETGITYKKLQKKCIVDYIKSSDKEDFHMNRIKFFYKINKYILSLKAVDNCLKLTKIGTDIFLDKKLDLNNFLSYYKTTNNKLFIKITNEDESKKKENKILNELSANTITLKCPHFPITYGSLVCKNNYIQMNEMVDGNLKDLLISKKNKDILNIITQIFISLMFFHNYIDAYYFGKDYEHYNYQEINPGGYFYYNIYGKDYYLENQGYLCILSNFKDVEPFSNNNKFGKSIYARMQINRDYSFILHRLHLHINFINKSLLNKKEIAIFQQLNLIINKYNNEFNINFLHNLDKEILEFLLKNVSSFTTKSSNFINKTPYIIR
jgi:hypothetical protein